MRFLNMIIVACIFFFPVQIHADENSFLVNSYWDSGKAEFQVYDATIKKYGIHRKAVAKLIIVKESFHKANLVKTIHPEDTVDVIKMNYIRTIPTGVYDYFQMASIFFDRKTGRILKFAVSSQDGCGTTFMEFLWKNNRYHHHFHSYFDDQGDGEVVIDNMNFVFYDALPVVLRFNLKDKKTYSIKLSDSMISNKAKPITLYTALVSKQIVEEKKGKRIYAVTVKSPGKKDMFYFEKEFPHRMIKWQKNNGDELTMKKTRFFYYWNFTKPEFDDMMK